MSPSPPNIIYLHSHDSGRWMQPYTDAVSTPKIAEFAKTAVVFTNAHTPTPTCSPSRGCLLTGSEPHQNGLTGLAHLGFKLKHPEWHLANFLKSQGYRTVLSGIQHEAFGSNESILAELGYEQYIGDETTGVPVYERDRLHAANAAKFLQSSESQEKPFFLSLGCFNTHRPFTEQAPWQGELPAELEDSPAARLDFAGFAESLKLLDEAVGVFLDGLEESPHKENTIVLLTTDHGSPYPGMKCNPTEMGTGVALMMRDGRCPGHAKIESLTSLLDVYPTLCDLAALSPPSHLRGRSLAPILEGEKQSIREQMGISINFHVSADPCRAIRTNDHLLVRYYPPDPSVEALTNIDNCGLKTSWLAEGRLPRKRKTTELYDLKRGATAPPVPINSANQGLVRELNGMLDQWMEETEDPLRHGSIRQPSNTRQLDKTATDSSAIRSISLTE